MIVTDVVKISVSWSWEDIITILPKTEPTGEVVILADYLCNFNMKDKDVSN